MVKADNFRYLREEDKAAYKCEHCVLCKFYPCELINEYEQFNKHNPDKSFGSSYTKNGCGMNRFEQVKCVTKYVSDGIGDHYKIKLNYNLKIEKKSIDRWEAAQPIIISAPTGSGKNTFTEKDLFPYVRELNHQRGIEQRVLMLSNRIAVNLQILDRINSGDDRVLDEDKMYSPYKGFDFVDVLSYQGLLSKADYLQRMQEDKSSRNRRYLFVVCDECHFFSSDAMFNYDTEKILSAITSVFKDSIRIYMTATPYECLTHIMEYERRNEKYERGVLYHFRRDYSYLDVKYYSHEDELMDLIAMSDDKWLLFIDDKEKCATLKDKLDAHMESIAGQDEDKADGKKSVDKKDVVFAVDADSKRNEKYRKMVHDEKFVDSTRVLITTSVLDNGVNFKDPKLKHVVVSDMSKVKCLQMVGRIRVGSADDRITLYLRRFDEKYVERKILDLKEQQNAYHHYDLAYEFPDASTDHTSRDNAVYAFKERYYFSSSNRTHENAKRWFGQESNNPYRPFQREIYYNKIARSLADTLVPTYEAILDEMRRTDNGQDVTGQRYLEFQLSWFGKTYDIANDLTLTGREEGRNRLVQFLEAHLGKRMFSSAEAELNEQKKFSEEFTKLYDATFQREDKNKTRKYGISKIRNLIEKQGLNYTIESQEDPATKKAYWVVGKVEDNTNVNQPE